MPARPLASTVDRELTQGEAMKQGARAGNAATSGPQVGELAVDERRGIGHVMEIGPSLVYLRPLGGGKEWEAPVDQVRRATAREVLAASMRARGLLSAGGGTTP
jgi:hypothetical protein